MQTRLLVMCSLLCASCAQEVVAHRQAERDANRIILVLQHYGIAAEKQPDGDARRPAFDVMVASEDKMQAYDVMDRYNLPRPPIVTTLDLVEEASLIPSAEQERARLELGLMGDLVQSLLEFPLITHAHAAVTLPKKEPLRDIDERQPRPKASVVLQYQASEQPPPFTKDMIQRFVQARLPEISPDEVHVEMIPSHALGPAEPEEPRAVPEKKIMIMLIGSISSAGVFAALMMFAVLRAMRYRRELTKLTAKLRV